MTETETETEGMADKNHTDIGDNIRHKNHTDIGDNIHVKEGQCSPDRKRAVAPACPIHGSIDYRKPGEERI
jgi:hypothetical protein